ncbi:MAG: hypothetical protein IJW64_02245 [Clostridia bacterium]|nr:hypothetical protein [Clostridia bacterium]
MNKVIIKTAIITFLSLVVAFILGVIGIYAFAPRLAGGYCYELGLKNMATECYERVYSKTGEFDDLVELVNSAIYAENDGVTSVYGEEMIERKSDFKNFCDKQIDENFQEGDYSTYDYYVNATMLAKYSLGNKQEAIEFAFSCALKSAGYTEHSALKMLVNMIETDESLGDIISEFYNAMTPPEQKYSFSGHVEFRNDMNNLGYTVS